MRFLFLNLTLLFIPTLSFALTSSEDVVCYGGMHRDKHVYLRTENSDGHKTLLVFMCDGPCSQPPYSFEASYNINRFERVVQNMCGFKQYRYLEIGAERDETYGPSTDAHVTVDLLDPNLAATLYMRFPGYNKDPKKLEATIYLSRCELVTGGNRPEVAR